MNTKEETFIIDDLLKELQTAVKAQLQTAGKTAVEVRTFKSNKDHACRIVADREKIRQTLVHLLDNSVKYIERGHIIIGYYVMDTNLVDFFVDDTGARMYHDTTHDLTAAQQSGFRLKERKPNDISSSVSFAVTCEQVEIFQVKIENDE